MNIDSSTSCPSTPTFSRGRLSDCDEIASIEAVSPRSSHFYNPLFEPNYHENCSCFRAIRPEDVENEAELFVHAVKKAPRPDFPPFSAFSTITWSMPSKGTIASIKKYMTVKGVGNILDVGCGRGYISWRLRREGIETFPIDHAPSLVKEWRLDGETFVDSQIFNTAAEVLHQIERNARDNALLLSWPPGYDPMGANALKAFKEGGGRLCFIMGDEGRELVGDGDMWKILDRTWTKEEAEEASQPLAVRIRISDVFHVYSCQPSWLESNDEDALTLAKIFS